MGRGRSCPGGQGFGLKSPQVSDVAAQSSCLCPKCTALLALQSRRLLRSRSRGASSLLRAQHRAALGIVPGSCWCPASPGDPCAQACGSACGLLHVLNFGARPLFPSVKAMRVSMPRCLLNPLWPRIKWKLLTTMPETFLFPFPFTSRISPPCDYHKSLLNGALPFSSRAFIKKADANIPAYTRTFLNTGLCPWTLMYMCTVFMSTNTISRFH